MGEIFEIASFDGSKDSTVDENKSESKRVSEYQPAWSAEYKTGSNPSFLS